MSDVNFVDPSSLTLTRKNGESIHVSGPCIVTILRDGGGRTRLQVTADQSTRILRSELLNKVPKPQ